MNTARMAVVAALLRLNSLRRALLLPAALLLCAVTGCGASGTEDQPAQLPEAGQAGTQPQVPVNGAGPAALPAPSTFVKAPSATGDPVRFCGASDIHGSLYNRLSGEIVDGVELTRMSPDFGSDADGIDGLAYAGFEMFNLDAYSGSSRLRLKWHTPPADSDNLWLAFSDFSNDRWVWRRGTAQGGELQLPQVPGWLGEDGYLIVLVVLGGSDEAVLEWLLYGDNYLAPYFSLSPLQGTAPLVVDFDTEGSTIAGAADYHFEFDYEGDGVFDVLDLQDTQFSHEYSQPGSFQPTLRIVDENEDSGEYARDLLVINPDNDPPVASLDVNITSGDAPLLVSFDGSASSDPDGELILYEWDFDGDNIWERESTEPVLNFVLGRAGANEVRLRVTDNDLATAIASVTVTLNKGWHYFTIDDEITDRPQPSCAVVGSLLSSDFAVAYFASETDEVRFARAENDECSDWTEPLAVAVSEAFHPFPSLRNVDERPAIAYQGSTPQGASTLCYVRAANSSGSSWQSPLVIDPALPSQPALGFANGNPAILVGERGNDGLMFTTAQNDQGSSWNSVEDILSAPPLFDMTDLSINSADGNPAGVYLLHGTDSDENSLFFIRAVDAAGADWNSPQPLGQSYGETACLSIISGRPALAYVSIEPERDVMFLRASDAQGSAWDAPVLVSDYGTPAGQVDLHSIGGTPVICWFDEGEDGRRLRYVEAENNEGTSWGISMPVSLCGSYGGSFDLASSAGMPVVVHAFGSNPAATILRASTLY